MSIPVLAPFLHMVIAEPFSRVEPWPWHRCLMVPREDGEGYARTHGEDADPGQAPDVYYDQGDTGFGEGQYKCLTCGRPEERGQPFDSLPIIRSGFTGEQVTVTHRYTATFV